MKSSVFKKDESARVSFAVIGVFLILGSSVTSVYISMYDNKSFDHITWKNNQQHIQNIIGTIRTDLSQIINTAGITALQYISSHPIILPSDRFNSAEEANMYRLKQKIAETLTNYVHCNYERYSFRQNSYVIQINLSKLKEKKFSSKDIKLTPIKMQLQRSFSIPFLGPEQRQNLPVYYKVSCNIPLTIQDTGIYNKMNATSMSLTIETVITSRFNLLNHLLNSFNSSLNGFGPFWKTITLITNVYSMARGYQHYQSGKPLNVVDNKHLELLTNLLLLFEESLTFNGIEPNLLLGSVKQATKMFSHKKTTNTSIMNSFLTNEWKIPFSEFQYITEENSKEKHKTVHHQQLINISDIASSILWKISSAQLTFIDENGNEHDVTYRYNSEQTLEETIQKYSDKGWQLTDTTKGTKKKNQTTANTIHNVSSSVYSAVYYTQVNRKGPVQIIYGDHNGFERDNGSSDWNVHQVKLTSKQQKPKKGTISKGSTILKETYNVIWKRTHQWIKKNQHITNNTNYTCKQKNVTDTRIERNVTFSVILKSYGNMNEVPGNIKNVLYENTLYHDTNLQTTFPSYHKSVYKPKKNELFSAKDGIYFEQIIYEPVPSWTQAAIETMLQEVYNQVSTITVSDDINVLNYPNPKKLVDLACQDIINQFESNKSKFIQKQNYTQHNTFQSTGKKAVYLIRKWYIESVGRCLQSYSTDLYADVENEISEALSEANVEDSSVFDETMDENILSGFNRQLIIPFSLPLTLHFKAKDPINSWNESVLFSIDHQPSYCSCFSKEEYEGKKEYNLGIRNTCLLGPSGLPILPVTPSTPWLVTFNSWLVQIRGVYDSFSLYDSNDETVFHPLFCHEPLHFVRKNEVIRSNNGTILGWNQPISFSVDTVGCSIVPSWGCMVGDTDGKLIEHNGKIFS